MFVFFSFFSKICLGEFMKIVVVSDNHGDRESLQMLSQTYYDFDLFLHAGDSEMSPEQLYPFVSVKGNNDYFDLPWERIIDTPFGKILLCHGHRLRVLPQERAKQLGCSLMIIGHLHQRRLFKTDEVTVICPGSVVRPRDQFPAGYVLIERNEQDPTWRISFHDIKSLNSPKV